MLLNTQTISKRTSRRSSKPRTDSEYLEAQRQIDIEYAKNMWTSRYMIVGDVIMVALLILSLIGGYMRNGHMPGEVLKSVFIASTAMTVHAVYLWHKTRGFFSELKKNKIVRNKICQTS